MTHSTRKNIQRRWWGIPTPGDAASVFVGRGRRGSRRDGTRVVREGKPFWKGGRLRIGPKPREGQKRIIVRDREA
jgi:ribosomal protein L4